MDDFLAALLLLTAFYPLNYNFHSHSFMVGCSDGHIPRPLFFVKFEDGFAQLLKYRGAGVS